ncbi:MAG: 50S ribosomal protein L19 [Verrucomicrobiota bacterium]|nr:50S ribosomal protein L19 [Verrucomicrobiota bacterium]
MSKLIRKIESEGMKKEGIGPFAVGDTVKVHTRIYEGDKERIQVFSGTVIARKHGGVRETFTVRRISHGVGVEKIFPLHSPHIARIEVDRATRVRRAKLYYLRGRKGKGTKLREREPQASAE